MAEDDWSEEFLASLGSLDEEIERPAAGTILDLKDPFEGWDVPED